MGIFQSMIICSVLRCTNPGSAFVFGNQNAAAGYHEAYLCGEHKAIVDAGAPWDMDERNVLMGRDLAPVLKHWSARPSVGSEGFTLTLEIDGRLKPVEFFLKPTEARTLSKFIGPANSDAD